MNHPFSISVTSRIDPSIRYPAGRGVSYSVPFGQRGRDQYLHCTYTPVLDQLLHMLNDENASDLRIHCAAYALARLATLHPEHRAPVVSALIVSLETTGRTDFDLVTTFASLLLDMRAVEAADAIGRGFAEGRIDKDIFRDWQRAREEMGLS